MTLSMILSAITGACVIIGLFFLYRSIRKLHEEIRLSQKISTQSDPSDAGLSVSRQMVHDLNNLLGTISGFTDAALEDLPKSSPLRTDLIEVLEASERAKNLVKQLQQNYGDPSPEKMPSNAPAKRTQTYLSASMETSGGFNRRPSYPPVAKPVPSYEKPKSIPPAARPGSRSHLLHTEGEISKHTMESYPPIALKASAVEIKEKRLPGHEHLLIVDDEIQLLTMFRRIFEPQGYQVTTFSNGLIAWDDFQKHCDMYDLAILDQRMPEMSGTSLAIEMLNCRPDFPIILLSGFSDTISPGDAARIGIRRFLSKPIPQTELSATIRKTLDELPDIAT